jgi:dipeptidyl-peptidase-4
VLRTVDAKGRPGSLAGYRFSPDGRRLLVSDGGDLYVFEGTGRDVQRITQTREPEDLPEFSPDGARLAYVRNGNLYAYDFAHRREWPLTKRPSPDVLNGRLDWVYEEELASRSGKAYSWSPDGRQVAYLQTDDAPVPEVTLLDFLQPAFPGSTQRFPASGDKNPVVRLGLVSFDADGRPGPERLVPLRDAEYLLPQLAWTPDSRQVAFQTLSRKQDHLELRLLDAARAADNPAATEHLVLAETDAAWVNVIGAPLFIDQGRAFLWLSERGGPRHLYRCATSDGSCRALTDGDWSVDTLLGADERGGVAYFTAALPNPRERQLYSVALSGDHLTRLTTEAGTHEIQLAPGARAFADVRGGVLTPPRVEASLLPSRRRQTVEANATPPVLGYELGEEEWIDVPAEGTVLHARLTRPSGAREGPRRPAVVIVYGGPHAQIVRDAWSLGLTRLLVGAGYVVWSLDNRGSGGRGHAFESVLRGELGKVELTDQLAGLAVLKRLPYVDGEHIGITGGSYGGYMTLYAIAHAPEAFAAAVAVAPVTDWRRYDTIYTERYLGLPDANGAGYDRSSVVGEAAAMKTPLLLIHGTSDDNVHMAHTLRLVAELHRARIPHDLALHPGESHSYRAPTDRIARDKATLAHFDRWLKGPRAAGPAQP